MPRFAGALGLSVSILATLPPYALAQPWIRSFGLVFPILTGVFITSISFVVTYVSVRAYLRERLLSVLFLGCGTLVFGCTSLLTAMLLGTHGLNFSGTVFAMGAFLSAAFHLACASSTHQGGTPRPHSGYHAPLLTAVALLCVVAVVAGALSGALPAFFEIGSGSTALAQVVLGASAVMFAGSSALIFNVFSSSRSPVLFRYSMALGATAAGILGVILSSGDVQAATMRLGWAALYLGGLLLLTSVLSAERQSATPRRPRSP